MLLCLGGAPHSSKHAAATAERAQDDRCLEGAEFARNPHAPEKPAWVLRTELPLPRAVVALGQVQGPVSGLGDAPAPAGAPPAPAKTVSPATALVRCFAR